MLSLSTLPDAEGAAQKVDCLALVTWLFGGQSGLKTSQSGLKALIPSTATELMATLDEDIDFTADI